MSIFLTIWGISSVILTLFFLIDQFFFTEKSADKDAEKLNVGDWFFFLVCSYTPVLQQFLMYVFICEAKENILKKKEEGDSWQKELNTLQKCTQCGLFIRTYKTMETTDESCCGRKHLQAVSQKDYPHIYEYALETGLTPEICRRDAMKMLNEKKKAEKEAIKQEKQRKFEQEIEQENKKEMAKILEKTKFIQEQNEIYMNVQFAKIEKINAEKERCKEEVIHTLEGKERENFINTIKEFDELYEIERANFIKFEKDSKENLSTLQQKIEKLIV